LRRVPASLASVSFYLIPIIGLAASALILGERLEPRQWLGAVVVLGAVLAIVWPRTETTVVHATG
jgi:drug/metabolite transporter (DMT)-like permease